MPAIAVELAAQDERRHSDLRRVDERQLRAHVDVGTGRHRVVERHGSRWRTPRWWRRPRCRGDRAGRCCARKRGRSGDGVSTGTRAAASCARRASGCLAGPDEGIEREPRHAFGMRWAKSAAFKAPEEDAVKQAVACRCTGNAAATSSAPFEMSKLIGRDLSERP